MSAQDRREQRYAEWEAIQRRDQFGCLAWPYASVPPVFMDRADHECWAPGRSEFEDEIIRAERDFGLTACLVPGGYIWVRADLAHDGSHRTPKTFPQVTELRRPNPPRRVSAGQSVAPSGAHQGKGRPGRRVSGPLPEVAMAHACHGMNPDCRCAHPEGAWALHMIPCTICGCAS